LRRPAFTRVILVVVDSAGIGELPDAAAYGDEGSNTIGNIAAQVGLAVPFLRSLGLGRVVTLDAGAPSGDQPPLGAFGRMAEASPGKDSVTGHWEIAGVVLDRPFPTFPSGFPVGVIDEFERRIGRGSLGNVVASGTEIIERLGDEHVRTGKPIVYTSADSVFQVAAHEDIIPIAEQYRMCEVAFDLVGRGLGVGRVIARPFIGVTGAYRRTANRHDYALEPAGVTLLDALTSAGQTVIAIGKIRDLFAGRGVTQALPTASDTDGMAALTQALADAPDGLVFVNLVDSDTQYGHRNDVAGYAANLERVDAGLAEVARRLRPDDLLVVTADHGNDPTTPSTDHSREHVPLLIAGDRVPAARDLGTRSTFADLGQTVAENFGVGPLRHGRSFLADLTGERGGG
jgi:phosphopentomutase